MLLFLLGNKRQKMFLTWAFGSQAISSMAHLEQPLPIELWRGMQDAHTGGALGHSIVGGLFYFYFLSISIFHFLTFVCI